MFDPFEEDDVNVDDLFSDDALEKKSLWQKFVDWRVAKHEERVSRAQQAQDLAQKRAVQKRRPVALQTNHFILNDEDQKTLDKIKQQQAEQKRVDYQTMTITVNGKRVSTEQFLDDAEGTIDREMKQLDREMEQLGRTLDKSFKELDESLKCLDKDIDSQLTTRFSRYESDSTRHAKKVMKEYMKNIIGTDDLGPR